MLSRDESRERESCSKGFRSSCDVVLGIESCASTRPEGAVKDVGDWTIRVGDGDKEEGDGPQMEGGGWT